MDQKKAFVIEAMGGVNFRELCREYGISAKTGYKWRERFLKGGVGGLEERSRKPHGHADALLEGVVCEIVKLKGRHPFWGPRKIRELYRRAHGGEMPSESSFKRVLERAGLTEKRKARSGGGSGRLESGRVGKAPNEVWTVDFKGWWKDREGLRVEPLTVRDEHSRMVLEVRLMENSRTEAVRACFEELFGRYGLPGAIRSDNGSPFATRRGVLGLSRLSAWWLALGIDLERGRPGRPQDNGAHERMHCDIYRELERGRLGRDQAAFDLWRETFNRERPHEGLGMKMPAEVYRRSDRRYEGTPDELDYGTMLSRRVDRTTGVVQYRKRRVMISTALAGWNVGLKPGEDGLVEVWFGRVLLGHMDPERESFQEAVSGRVVAGQPEAATCNH